jgi:protein-tyrosine phosphatase
MIKRPKVPERLRPWVGALRSRDERLDLLWELRRRARGAPGLPERPIDRLLVICLGNICRSPFGERYLANACPRLSVRSAGFGAADGDPAPNEAVCVAREFDIDLTRHAARRMTRDDAEWADLIVAMSGRHYAMMAERWPEHLGKIRMLGDFLDTAPHVIPDPWGQPAAAFRTVYAQIVRAGERLAIDLEATRGGGR